MKLTISSLKQLIHQTLIESAVKANSLPTNVGLVMQFDKWSVQMALVSLDLVEKTIAEPSKLKNAVIGGITATREDVWRVNAVSSRHGYGPLLYRLMMQFVTSRGSMLSSHQSGITSREAEVVWKRFKTEPDVRKIELPDKIGIRGTAFQLDGNDFERLSQRYEMLRLSKDKDSEVKYHVFNVVRNNATFSDDEE